MGDRPAENTDTEDIPEMTGEKWMHSIKEGAEIRIDTYIGEYRSRQELIEMLDKKINRTQSGVFLTANERTKEALAVFITKDSWLDADRYKINCLSMFKKAELKGNPEFKKTKSGMIGIAEMNTGILGSLLDGEELRKMLTESFEGIRERTIKTLITKGYSEGKIGP